MQHSADFYTWSDVEQFIIDLTTLVIDSGFTPDFIGGIPRGGWTVAALMAQSLGIRRTISMDIETIDGKKQVYLCSDPYNAEVRLQGARVLLLEDSLETGSTLEAAANAVANSGVPEVRTAAFTVSRHCKKLPDYHVLRESTLRSFPWDHPTGFSEL